VFLEVPEPALALGFANDPVGTHGSRTIMLKELKLLLDACPPGTTYEEYRDAIVDDNVLLKKTLSTRKESFRRLRELYVLEHQALLFRALRDLWGESPDAHPLLALLCAAARDSILRESARLILSLPAGADVTPQMIEATTEEGFPGRYNPTMLANIGRYAASSWQQSGHLKGRLKKVRVKAKPTPSATTYALFLGYLCGNRGEALFDTIWANLLDAPANVLHDQAFQASQRGWLEYRHSGTVTDISFRHLLRGHEQEVPA
jgi:hypothetical protein